MCVCSHPLVLILLLFLTAGGGELSIRVNPSLFQLALDTPAPSEPTPTQASRHSQLCEGQPCLNGGSCLALPSSHNQENTFNQEYTCSCSQDFTGRNCEVRTCYCVMCLNARTKLVYLKETQQSHNAKVVLCLQIWLDVKCQRHILMQYCLRCVRLTTVSLINLCIFSPLLHLAVCCFFFFSKLVL